MAKLSDLKLGTDAVGDDTTDFANMPDQMGGAFPDPPYPGAYRLQLPNAQAMQSIWDLVDYEGEGVKNPGKRIVAKFNSDAPLVIVQSAGGAMDGEPWQTRISNVERRRGKKDDPTAPFVSDMDYLLRDAFGVETKPKTNMAYAQALTQFAGKDFGVDISWSWRCDPKKNIRVEDETAAGGYKEVEGQPGCGNKWYEQDITKSGLLVLADPEKPEGRKVFPLRITCPCGANVRAFANIERFRP